MALRFRERFLARTSSASAVDRRDHLDREQGDRTARLESPRERFGNRLPSDHRPQYSKGARMSDDRDLSAVISDGMQRIPELANAALQVVDAFAEAQRRHADVGLPGLRRRLLF